MRNRSIATALAVAAMAAGSLGGMSMLARTPANAIMLQSIAASTTGGYSLISSAVASAGSAVPMRSGGTHGSSRNRGHHYTGVRVSVAQGKRNARKYRNRLRARGHHRAAVR